MTAATAAAAPLVRLNPFQAVVFDMDGTLLDTEALFREVLFEVSLEFGVDMTDGLHLAMIGGSKEHNDRLRSIALGQPFP